jgi:ethanolamine utilization protein EutN
MFLARVIGSVVSTVKHEFYLGEKLLLVQRVDPDLKDVGLPTVIIDGQQAGIGDIIFVVDEGNSARQIKNSPGAPVRSANLGIVDEIARQ